jgi:hypothetical protein
MKKYSINYGVLCMYDSFLDSYIEVVTDDENDRYYLSQDEYKSVMKKFGYLNNIGPFTIY